MEPETIICRICNTEYEITDSIVCSCGEEIFTSRQLREQIQALDRIALQARTESLILQTELWLRERRRTNTSPTGQKLPQDFWRNCHGKPDWAKVSRQGRRKEDRREREINWQELD